METKDEKAPGKKPPFWSSLAGMITALATAAGAAATLTTTLYSSGIIGQVRAQQRTAHAAPAMPAAPASSIPAPRSEGEGAKRIADETAGRQQMAEAARKKAEDAEAARARAEAEAARLKRERAEAERALEAKRRAEIEAARKKAEEADLGRAKAEAEMDRLRREQAEVVAREREEKAQAELAEAQRKAQEGDALRAKLEAEMERLKNGQLSAIARLAERTSRQPQPPSPVAPPEPPRQQPRFRDAVVGFRVVHISNTEIVIEVDYTIDRSRAGTAVAGAILRYQGRPISGYRPAGVAEEKGSIRIPLTVRTQVGGQSDELEVFLYRDREKIATRTFGFRRTFEQASGRESVSPTRPSVTPTIPPPPYRPAGALIKEIPNVRPIRGL